MQTAWHGILFLLMCLWHISHKYNFSSNDFAGWCNSAQRMWYFSYLNNTTLIQGSMAYCENIIGSWFYLLQEILNPVRSFHLFLIPIFWYSGFSWYFILLYSMVRQNFLCASCFDILFALQTYPGFQNLHYLLHIYYLTYRYIILFSGFSSYLHFCYTSRTLRFSWCFLMCNIWCSIFHIFFFYVLFSRFFLIIVSPFHVCLFFSGFSWYFLFWRFKSRSSFPYNPFFFNKHFMALLELQRCQLLKPKCGWSVNSASQPANYSKSPKWSAGVKTLKVFALWP